MKLLWLSLLTSVAILAGCADGGPTGTGLSTSISGNIIEVELLSQIDEAPIASVRVSIDELPGVEDTTNEEGDFDLVGAFSGRLTLRFTKLDVSAAQTLDVPAGSSIVLEDVAFGKQGFQVGAARQLGFFGTVAFVDCAAGDLLVDDRAQAQNQFLVRLALDPIVVNGSGDLLSCAALATGKPVAIEGMIRLGDGSIEAVTITVDPPGPGQPSPVVETSFAGTVTLINCESGMAQIAGQTGTVRLRLSQQADLVDRSGRPIECAAILPGDDVEGTGLIRVRRPEVVDVIELRATMGG